MYWQDWYNQSVDTDLDSQRITQETNAVSQGSLFVHNDEHMKYFNQIRECIELEGKDSKVLELPSATDVEAWESLCWSYDGNHSKLYSMEKLPMRELSCLDHVSVVFLYLRLFSLIVDTVAMCFTHTLF